ncbi:hypothetical protein [Streptococcus mutans]|uniref:hypothetical protein n=1 Tax=Streptococcus mutans TaxID=1309 RepID=UPI0014553E5F|nr:hypothetical protein [Streptococcus mutans]NLQ74990.1 hypothetical protein [Streptococcus mutans]
MKKNYSAIICEGAAEEAIVEILLENNCIVIENDEYLIGNGPIRIRDAKKFCDTYMGKNYGSKIDLFRIIDSKNENFNFGSARYRKIFQEKIEVINVITPPEIELLIIVSENRFKKFSNSHHSKPSDYCMQELKINSVKSFKFVKEYFSDVNKLLDAIKEVHRIKQSSIPKHFRTLYDLLKDEFKQ